MSEIPHSLAILSAVFKEQGYEVKAVINSFKERLDTLDYIAIAEGYKPDIIGISMLTMQVLKTYEVMGKLKLLGYPIIAGGAHPTACAAEVISHGADIAVRNEGEDTLRDILQGKPLNQVEGITYRDKGGIVHNPPRPRIKDLSKLPMPDFSGFDVDLLSHLC